MLKYLKYKAFIPHIVLQTNLFIQLVDINDHDPVFTQHVYHFNATENDATGIMNEVIGIVSATDLDQGMNGQVTYQITSRNAVDRFTMQNVCSCTIYLHNNYLSYHMINEVS